jgi:large subunit ribosomal protein L4
MNTKIPVVDLKGKSVGEMDAPVEVFGVEPNEAVVHFVCEGQRFRFYKKNACTKGRSAVSGGGKKARKQKGTGGARAGSVKSGTRVGGGRIFGPRPRNYHFKLNIKLKRLARKSAFSFKAQNEGLMVLEDLAFANAKTKEFVNLMNALQLSNQKVLLILGDKNDSVYLASRNLGKVKVVTADSVNTFDVLNARKVVMTSSSVGRIEEILN